MKGRIQKNKTTLRALLFALAVAAAGFLDPDSAQGGEAVDLALVIATDTSRSIDEAEARLQRDGVSAALRDPQVIQAIQSGYHRRIGVAYIDWSSDLYTTVVVPWRIIDSAASAEEYARILNEGRITLGQRTSISDGLALAYKLLSDGTMQATRQVIDVSGDGPNNRGRLVTEARDEIVSKGVTINGLPIINMRDQYGPGMFLKDLDDYYRGCVIGGQGAFIIVAKNFEDFANAIRRKLIIEIAGETPPATPPVVPVNNRGIVPIASSDPQKFGSGFVYEPGCDIGERAWQRQLDYYNPGRR